MSDIDLRNGVRVTVTAPAPRFTVSAPSSAVAVLPVRGPAGADGTGGGGGGVTDHGALTGLADDDHLQYHTDARGDVRYYTKTQVDTALAGKSATTHTHTAGDVGAEPAGTVAAHEADTLGVHGIADTAALVVTTDPRLSDARTPIAHTHPTAEVTGLDTALAGKADDGHLHDDRYYTETEVDTALAGKAAASHNHVAADVTDLGTAATKDIPATGDALAGQVVVGSDTRLTDARTPTAHTHPSGEVTGLAAVATSGAYVDLTGKPAIPDSPDDIGAEAAGTAASAVAAHEAAADPHSQYLSTLTGQGFRAYKALGQAVSASTHTVVIFDVIDRDDTGNYNASTGEWTVNATDWWDITAYVYLQTPSVGDRHIINIRVNGADAARINDAAATGTNSMVVGGGTSLYLTVGQVVTITAWRSAAGNINGGQQMCFFTAKRRYAA